MENLNEIFSKNITRLRNAHNLTQFELGARLNYSDKAVSRWERGEAIPDAKVLVGLSEIFGVTVDDLLKNKEVKSTRVLTNKQWRENKTIIPLISFIGVWTLALMLFFILNIFEITYWMIFAYALPVSVIVLLVFSAIWWNKQMNAFFVSLLCWSVILCIYLAFLNYNRWLLFIIGIPVQILVILGFRIHNHK